MVQLNSNLTFILDYSQVFTGFIRVTNQCLYQVACYLCVDIVVPQI